MRLGRPLLAHPAILVVERVECMWQSDRFIVSDRARLIVQRLIETGHLRGKMHADLPLALDDDLEIPPFPGARP
jgi:hypothetical protein